MVLAIQSKFFEKALNENFKEGKDKEFHFKEGSAHSYWRVFQYMYTGDYDNEPTGVLDAQGWHPFWGTNIFGTDQCPDDEALVKHVRVYAAAEFFMLDDLKELTLPRFKSKLDELWVSELLVDCIREVYQSTPESDHGLRNTVVEVVYNHRHELWNRKSFRDFISDGGDFVVDLMSRWLSLSETCHLTSEVGTSAYQA